MIATTIEQSKRLLELGLKPETADCYWDHDVIKKEDYPMFMDDQYDDLCIPAWSLSALLNLLPSRLWVDSEYKNYNLEMGKNSLNEFYIKYSFNYTTELLISTTGTAINAANEMCVWLLENGYIKK